MIILDTCVLIFDALTPAKIPAKAKKTITNAEKNKQLFCCDISLWEIAMLIEKNRLHPGTDTNTFLELILQSRKLQVLSITTEIAALSVSDVIFKHYDPADRLIAATTIVHHANLITCDKHLNAIEELSIIW